MFFPTENTCVCIYVFIYVYIYKCILLNWNTTEQERQAQKLLGKVSVFSMGLCWQCAKVSGIKRTG